MENGARLAALEALQRCRRDGAWSAQAMDAAIRKHGLDRRDAALATRLCLAVLQNEDYLDWHIDRLCSSAPEKGLRDLLRLGACQLLLTDRIPQHAAVGETVALCRASGYARAAGFCNAVLRRLAESRDALPEIPGEGTAEYLHTRYSHPLWLAERLIAQEGYGRAEAFFRANNVAPPLCLQVNTRKVSVSDYCLALVRAEIPYEKEETLPGCLTLSGGSVAALPGYEEGLFYVQDRAARAAVEIAAPEKGMRVLDACAAPGGKSFAASIRMEDEGSILACDLQEKKLRRVRSASGRRSAKRAMRKSPRSRPFRRRSSTTSAAMSNRAACCSTPPARCLTLKTPRRRAPSSHGMRILPPRTLRSAAYTAKRAAIPSGRRSTLQTDSLSAK